MSFDAGEVTERLENEQSSFTTHSVCEREREIEKERKRERGRARERSIYRVNQNFCYKQIW